MQRPLKKHKILPTLPCYLLGYIKHYVAANFTMFRIVYTGCFTTLGHKCRRWFPRSLWWKMFIQTCVRFWTVTELWAFFSSRTRPRVNRVYQLGRILDAADHIRNSQLKLLSRSRGSQPNGSLCCGRRRHFRKPSLSTDKFKLKVISRS